MGMSSHVVGVKPPDDKWKQMKAVWDVCTKAKVEIPLDVIKFFNGETPDDKGVIVNLESKMDLNSNAVKGYHAEMIDGFEVDLKLLPKDITILRFYNSY